MYRPSLKELLHGALNSAPPAVEHYVSNFRYPRQGGFLAYLHSFVRKSELNLGHEVVRVDPKARQIHFANRRITDFDRLVSSVPLPELIPIIDGVPADVLAAAQRLACSTCVLVNIGVARADLSRAHMTYFYDADICFTRLSFPHMLAPSNAPDGCGSIQAEVYFSSKYRPLVGSPEDCIDRIVSRGAALVRYANVIFDLERASALQIVHGYLDDLGIAFCGRYGDWGYMWTDESFVSGERAAESALSVTQR
jgi:protoporphyrinogen oxidase